MNFLKRNIFLILILILSVFLRLNYDTFILGYNFDEFAMVSVAKDNISQIFKTIAQIDYHAPLYYLVIHPFVNLINSDLILRLLNIIFSLINVYVFYKIGKLLINKHFGLVLALLLAVNHLQISIANFIKFYCLAFLLFSISIYYLIKFIKKDKNEIKLAITNSFFILSNTLGFLWVFVENLLLYKIKKSKKLLNSFSITFFSFILYLPILFVQTKSAFNSIISAHGDYPSISFLGFFTFLNDYFSPLINYSCNTQTIESIPLLIKSLKSLQEGINFDWVSFISFVLLSLIPVLIGIFGIFKAVKKDKTIDFLLIITSVNILIYLTLIALEITGYLPIYQFSSGLALIIISTFGLYSIKNKKLRAFLISYLVIAQLIITNAYPIEKRENKYKLFGNLDYEISKIDNKTPIMMFDAARFAKHYYKDKNIFDIDFEELEGSHSRKWIELIYGEKIAKNANAKNFKELIKPFIQEKKQSKKLEEFLLKEFMDKIKQKENFILIYNTDGKIFRFSNEEINSLLEMDYSHKKETSTLKYQLNKKDNEFLTQSYLGEIVNSYSIKLIIEVIEKYFKAIKIEQFIQNDNGKYFKHFETSANSININDLMTKSTAGWIFVTYQKQ